MPALRLFGRIEAIQEVKNFQVFRSHSGGFGTFVDQKEFDERIKSPAIQKLILSHQMGGMDDNAKNDNNL